MKYSAVTYFRTHTLNHPPQVRTFTYEFLLSHFEKVPTTYVLVRRSRMHMQYALRTRTIALKYFVYPRGYLLQSQLSFLERHF